MKLTRRRFLGLIGAGVAAGGIYSVGIEPAWLRTVRVEVPLAGLPSAFDGYTIAQLSDLHVGSAVPAGFLERAVKEANAAGPDLAVVTGDVVDAGGREGVAEQAAGILERLSAHDGVCAVLGNHDTGAFHEGMTPDGAGARRLVGLLEDVGLRVLRNETTSVERGRERLRLVGCGDLWSGHFDPPRVATGDAPTVVLSHNPDTAPELARRGAGLILSGHTHGGQVRFPLLGPPYVPVRHKEFLAGPYRVGDAHLYVNPGLGYTYRVRFGARPEVTVLVLRSS